MGGGGQDQGGPCCPSPSTQPWVAGGERKENLPIGQAVAPQLDSPRLFLALQTGGRSLPCGVQGKKGRDHTTP